MRPPSSRLALTALALLAAASAQAEDGCYFQTSYYRTNALALHWIVDSGAIPEYHAWGVDKVTGTDHFNRGSGFSLEFGYTLGAWRASLEYNHTAFYDGYFDDSQGHTGPYSARQRYQIGLLNVYRDIRLNRHLSLYLGAGAGAGRSDHHLDNGTDQTDGNYGLFAYQFRGGVALQLIEHWSLTAGLRFLHVEGGANTITFPKANFPFLQTINTTSLTVGDAWVRSYEIGLRHSF